MRVGWGFDAHRFGGGGPLLLAGIVADSHRGLVATSDGDVVAHAVADALLGAAALGDLGTHFPAGEPEWEDADSMELLRSVAAMVSTAGFTVASIDVTVVAESVRVAPLRDSMREALAAVLDVDVAAVSVKATSTDGLGFTGTEEGMAAVAVAVLG